MDEGSDLCIVQRLKSSRIFFAVTSFSYIFNQLVRRGHRALYRTKWNFYYFIYIYILLF